MKTTEQECFFQVDFYGSFSLLLTDQCSNVIRFVCCTRIVVCFHTREPPLARVYISLHKTRGKESPSRKVGYFRKIYFRFLRSSILSWASSSGIGAKPVSLAKSFMLFITKRA